MSAAGESVGMARSQATRRAPGILLALGLLFVTPVAYGSGGTDAVSAYSTQDRAERLYRLHCAGCHLQNGVGLAAKGIPNLRESGRYVDTVEGRQYLGQVPGVAQARLDDASAAAVLNWSLRQFSGDCLPAAFKPFTASELRELRANPASDAAARKATLASIAPPCPAVRQAASTRF
jgi:mono/diheme cytochrome c family protein